MAKAESATGTAVETEVEYKKGLTWRVLIASLYAIVIFMPANIFMGLLTGGGISVGYAIILFFTGIAAIYGTSISRQETWLLMSMTGAVGQTTALGLLQSLYSTRLSPEVWRFRTPDTGVPLPYATPDWYAPNPFSLALLQRTFLSADWLMPVLVTASQIVIGLLVNISLGLIMYQLYAVEEKLPFPMQHVQAEAVITMAERETKKMTILYLTAFIGFLYAFFLYFFPLALGLAALAPIPFADLTPLAEWYVPGTMLGVATDIGNFLLAFILPLHVVVNIFIGSIAVYIYGNAILVHLFPSPPAGLFGWVPAMPAFRIAMWSQVYVWFGPIIGMSLVAALYPLLRHPSAVARAFKGLTVVSKIARGKGLIDSRYLLLMYFAATGVQVAIAAWLVPKAPIWLFIFLSINWTFLNSMIIGRALAMTTLSLTVPYVRETLYLTLYPGTDIWFAPLLGDAAASAAAGWTASFKVCELTQTKFTNFIAGTVLATAIGVVMSFVFTELLWKTSPIPEGWPAAAMLWPMSATTGALWITRSFQMTAVRPETVLGAAGVALALSVVGEFAHLPISVISIVMGMWTLPHYAISYLIGAAAYKILEIRIGKEWMMANRVTIVAGFGIGSSTAMTLAAFWGLTTKSMFVIPF